MTSRSAASDSGRNFSPSSLASSADWLFEMLYKMRIHEANRVHHGLMTMTPTTPSSQVVGAGATTWNIDIVGGLVAVNGVVAEIADAADFSIHSATQLLTAGQSVIASIVVKNVAGTLSVVAVKGAAATTGSQVAPLPGAIDTACGAGVPWIKLADVTLNRAADGGGVGVVTQSQDNTQRPALGITVDASFGDVSVL